MLKIVADQYHPGRLLLICDYCQKEITDAELAIYAWKVRYPDYRIADGVVYTLHKGVCDHATTESDNDHEKSLYRWYWDELSGLPSELIGSLGMTWDRAQGKLRMITEENEEQIAERRIRIEQEVQEWRESAGYST